MKPNQRTLLYIILCSVLTVGGIFSASYFSQDEFSDSAILEGSYETVLEEADEEITEPTQDPSLTPLGTPQELIWNYYPQTYFDDNGNHQELEPSPGTVCWKPGDLLDPSGGTVYRLCLYRDNEIIYDDSCGYDNENLEDYDFNSEHLAYELEFESGEYYFTLQATTDTEGYRNSEIAVSEVWHYEQPEYQFAKPEKLTWIGDEITWYADSEISENHQIEYFYAETKDDEPSYFMSSWCNPCETYEGEDAWYLEDPGYYYVRVRVLSPDITKYQNSPWSELSNAYHVPGTN